MVRLKQCIFPWLGKNSFKFQFLYGAIKTVNVHPSRSMSTQFQFLYGAIKTHTLPLVVAELNGFQFLYGAIKTAIPQGSPEQP